MYRISAFLLLILVLAACGGDDKTPVTNTFSQPATLAPALVHLQRDYEALTAAHEKSSATWDQLATNEQVQCGDYPAVPGPEGISAEDSPDLAPLADHLRDAAIALEQSITLWQAECANPRANPSPSVINEGRLAARAAGDSLQQAETLLGAIQ